MTIIYIEGFGRSGTTLLDAMLGQVEGFCSLGETAYLWDRGLTPGERCGCGAPAARCPLWSEVLDAVQTGAHSMLPEQMTYWRDHAFRLRETAAAPRVFDVRVMARAERYLTALSHVYRTVAAMTGADVLVDSSKSARHGHMLHLLPRVTVHTVHLVRDPRAVAFSWQRDRADEGLPARPVGRNAKAWTFEEAVAEMLRAQRRGTRSVVRYEDLIAAPVPVLRKILREAGIDGAKLDFVGDSSVRLEPNHIVCGNPSRFRTGLVTLSLDAEWETAMDRRQVAAVTAVCLPWIVRYGYPIRAGRFQPLS
ncbi:sulfotransferase [Frankia sp. AgB1.9]|uniref:sulfotransferase family protein n=1 Tax=unclassified Frankia TaxID=2632575 RepID=UPI001933DC34|nr:MULTISPECIES: sulfotransferase [unclassified Frankia]MBL7493553.1 sulfotransferase [Frankia sp. AgW1.1]MBL7553456.1 sulfotransferase [Frankia sp. AgB1.9]MBL7622309.1 sulfotransferase [Frankia sp. AgB1.8]